MKTAQNGTQADRIKELQACFDGIDDGILSLVQPLIAETAHLEGELDFLRELPKLRVHPDDPKRQQATPAAKLYKELLQQYTNCVKVLSAVLRRDAPEEESPLQAYLKERRQQNGGA